MEQYELDAIAQITTQPARKYRTIEVETLTPVIGAEVTGIDLAEELTEEQLGELRAAFLDHHVLVFRDQVITPEQHKRLAGHFGELRPVNPPPPEGDPYILEISTSPEAANVAGNGWHADGTADAEPSLGSMLYITKTPEPGSGGDTLFANMHLAYAMLSPAMRAMLDGMTAVHDGMVAFQGYEVPAGYVVPKNEHPLVVRHPETGRKLLYVNKAYTARIPQLSADESRAVLDMLFDFIARRPVLNCRVRWRPNTLVFWDNRCVQHHATYDYYPFARYGQRVAINGGPLQG
ncbi:TauD/TfdA dioxygenase family protein [Streptantibioticus cattleyicolor]|uniref:Taurine dioxygenase n=1 Tax=Streptantibioticus cattleyicolor (strain ATCC 35852 / DSM 46488 / JCM 4925 / NBRC 14057 / NRRL 8057) TaxID=1003195 RepID=F8JJD8_STREN|nr:TauD/TfdA family dioxygenase [Streptantibioticus cattleyicolor]AEW98740.1 Taurine dioxygenase [Streptantibioticus cattleyicolor NRRL 8057 = DSM 46488]CCB72208.1 putative taurine catabolism dioxygenase [Streptantibioticus cattleyicolor NRRL 8057 = DSM 46488]